jgi:t-SNARE complex subunit (syntaxin)
MVSQPGFYVLPWYAIDQDIETQQHSVLSGTRKESQIIQTNLDALLFPVTLFLVVVVVVVIIVIIIILVVIFITL